TLNGLADDQIRFFVDGVPLEYAGWGLGIANVPVDLVQRVDVYRGVVPIGLGADALGGAIDLVTDPSWVDRASVSYQVGSFGTHRVSAGARARDDASGLAVGLSLFGDRATNDYPIDVEVADERGRLTPATVRRFHDGYMAGGAIVEAGVVGKGAIERALIRAFATQYSKELQHNTVMTIPYGDASYAGDSRGAAADLAVTTGAWHGRLIAGVARTATDFRDIGLTVYDWYGRAVRDRRIAGEIGLDPIQQRITETGLYARANLERRFGDHHTLRVALAPTSHHRDGRDFLDPNPGGRDPISARRDLVQVVSGVELEQTARGDRLENIAFAKHYLHASDAEDARPGFVFVPIADTISRFGAGDSLRYRVSDAVAVKASYEWATRMPSVDELFGDGILVQPNLELAPETSHNANLGVHLERETRHGAWGGEVGGFARLADQLIVLIGNDRLFSYQNVYAVRILGIEGSAAWVAPGEWASIEANLTVQDIRNSSSEGTFGDFEGDRIPNRPWLLGSVAASVRRRGVVRAGDELSLFGTSRYVHEFFRGWESQGVREFKQVVPSQLVHGAGVTYAARGRMPVITTVEVQNLSDARVYDSFGVQRPGRALFVKLSGEL
ncbi:MAG TPA: TonB-dependent receptor, partial [Kofleriaceae bacterium]|nr:TonB-dependent receptor [Kofleriaceae bacterium]